MNVLQASLKQNQELTQEDENLKKLEEVILGVWSDDRQKVTTTILAYWS